MHRQSNVAPVGVVLVTSITPQWASQNGHSCRALDMGVGFICDVALAYGDVGRGERNGSRQKQTRDRISTSVLPLATTMSSEVL